jgi:RHS repeat-associated protein
VGGANLKKETIYYYDGNNTDYTTPPDAGNLTRLEGKSDSTNSISSYYTYDTYGNRLSEQDPNGHTTTWTYETGYNTYPQTKAYPVTGLSESYVYLAGTGSLSSQTDVNGQTTSYYYDAFQRLVKAVKHGNSEQDPSIEYQYNHFGEAGRQNIKMVTKADGGKYLWQSQFFDGLGRVFETYNPGEEGNETIVSLITYDNMGRVYREYLPQAVCGEAFELLTLRPNANGTTINLNRYPNQGESNYQNVDEAVANDNTDYNYKNYGTDIYQLEDGAYDTSTIASVTAYVRYKGTSSIYIRIRTHSTNYSVIQYPKESWTTTSYTWETNPYTQSAWTWEEVNDLQAGISITYSKDKSASCTQVYVEVACYGTAPDTGYNNTQYAYDKMGRLVTQYNPDGTSISYDYSTAWQVLMTNKRGYKTRYFYDAFQRLVKVEELNASHQLYAATEYSYDVLGNLVEVVDNDDNTTSMTYDWLSRKTEMSDPDMGTWSYGYDYNGNLTSQTDALNRTITLSYDGINRLTGKTYPQGSGMTNVTYSYDSTTGGNYGKGLRTGMSDAIGVTYYKYDTRGRLIEETRTGGSIECITMYTYDNLDRLSAVFYPTEEVAVTAYDDRGYPAGLLFSSNVIANANMESGNPPDSWTLYGSGASQSQSTAQVKNGLYSLALTRSGSDCVSYQALTGYQQYADKTVTFGAWVWSDTANSASIYVDDGVSYAQSAYHPGDSQWHWLTVSYTVSSSPYFVAARLAVYNTDATAYFDGALILAEFNSLVSNTEYNHLGQVTEINLGNGLTTTFGYWGVGGAYDTTGGYFGNLWEIKTFPEVGSALQDVKHTWDGAGNLTQREDVIAQETESFAYDFLDRLTAVSGPYSHSYSYDEIGNITSMNGVYYTYGGSKPHAVTAVGDADYTYDANGNMTDRDGQTITWDVENRPVTIGSSAFIYDGNGNRVLKTEGGETVLYINRYFEKNVTTGVVTTSFYLGDRLVAQREGTTLRYVHQDHLTGTSVMSSDSGTLISGIKYYPFGETMSGSVNTDKQFTGQRIDGTGLYYYGARYYDPIIGRFISSDVFVSDPINPQSLNRYSYVLNNPLKYLDPSGHVELLFEDSLLQEAYDLGYDALVSLYYDEQIPQAFIEWLLLAEGEVYISWSIFGLDEGAITLGVSWANEQHIGLDLYLQSKTIEKISTIVFHELWHAFEGSMTDSVYEEACAYKFEYLISIELGITPSSNVALCLDIDLRKSAEDQEYDLKEIQKQWREYPGAAFKLYTSLPIEPQGKGYFKEMGAAIRYGITLVKYMIWG